VQRQRYLPLHCHLVDRARASGIEPVIRHAVLPRLRDHLRIKRVEKDVELRLIQITVMLDAGGLVNAIGVV
jgi:hypothetical protein